MIDCDEFTKYMKLKISEQNAAAERSMAFALLGGDDDLELDFERLQAYAMSVDMDASDHDLMGLVDEAEREGLVPINHAEVLKMVKQHNLQ